MIRLLIAAAAIMVACAGSARAALSAYDGFNYAAGDLTGQNGGSGWSGAYTDTGNSTLAETTGLAFAGLATNPGSARMNDGSGTTTINFRNLAEVYGDNETETWISFLGRRNGPTVTNLFAGVSFYNTGGAAVANGEVSFATTTSGSTIPGLPDWRILDLGANVSTNANVGIDENIVDLLVARIVWNVPDAGITGTGDDAVYLWVNPTVGGPTPMNAAANAARNVAIMDFDKVRVAGQNALDYSFDEIRLGTSFADVTPVMPPDTDFDGIGGTTLADFHVLRGNYLTGTQHTQGDANFDGLVNHADFFLWRTAFVGAGGSLEGLNLSVPEPAAGVVALGLCLFGRPLARRASRRRD